MRYSYDDFKSIKCKAGLYCEVGMFGDDIYVLIIWAKDIHHTILNRKRWVYES